MSNNLRSLPKEISTERRKYIRLEAIFPVDFQLIKGKNIDSLFRTVQGFTRNVSWGGLCIEVKNLDPTFVDLLLDNSTLLGVNINIPLTAKPACAIATVAWMNSQITDAGTYYFIGIQYKDISNQDRIRIMRYVKRIKILPKVIVSSFIFLVILVGFLFIRQQAIRIQNQTTINSLLKTTNEKLQVESLFRQVSVNRLQLEKELKESYAKTAKEIAELNLKLKEAISNQSTLQTRLTDIRYKSVRLEEATLNQMYKWLVTHQSKRTGLVVSFEGDKTVEDWAFTYDQSLAAQVYTLFGDFVLAKKIFDFYKFKAPIIDGGFVNAYDAYTGGIVESIQNTGPNIWLGISILQYQNKTNDPQYFDLAQQIANWAMKLRDRDGGFVGGPQINWYSTEHNLDAYAFFNMLYEITKDTTYKEVRDKTLSWIKLHAYDKTQVRMKRGKGDATIATDTFSWAIAAIGPAILKQEGMDPDGILEFAEENCKVTTKFIRPDKTEVSVTGFDFSKYSNIPRGGVVSSEWTAQMIVAFDIIKNFYLKNGDAESAKKYEEKKIFYLSELDKLIITSLSRLGQGAGCLPYATQEDIDTGHGWRTAKGSRTGSVSATAYGIFAKKGYNPLELE